MTYGGQGRHVAGDQVGIAEAASADIQEQGRTLEDIEDESALAARVFTAPAEASVEDAWEQARSVELDDEDGRR